MLLYIHILLYLVASMLLVLLLIGRDLNSVVTVHAFWPTDLRQCTSISSSGTLERPHWQSVLNCMVAL